MHVNIDLSRKDTHAAKLVAESIALLEVKGAQETRRALLAARIPKKVIDRVLAPDGRKRPCAP